MNEAARTRVVFRGSTVWNINSTAAGGGVAEMLQVLVGYILGAGVAVRWLVIVGNPDFFSVTKRIHNRLHGMVGDGGGLGAAEALSYELVQVANVRSITPQIRPADVVILHDPQTAGLVAPLKAAGAVVLWRCHVGTDARNDWTEEAWSFLRPYLEACDGFVFTRQEYVPAWIPTDRVWIIPPSIDPFSPKNQELSEVERLQVLTDMGVLDARPTGAATFTRRVRFGGSYRPAGDGGGRRPPGSLLYLSCSRCLVGTT